MTTTSQLVSAADAANWSAFKSLLISATPADIEMIGSEWNTVMAAIATGVQDSAPASKGLFTSAMTAFFAVATPYLIGDTVVQALTNIAENAAFTATDHISVEMIAILNTLPTTIAASVTSNAVTNLMFGITYNQINPEVTSAEFKNVFAAVINKFSPQIDVEGLLNVASSIAQEDSNLGLDHLSTVRMLLAAQPANQETANPFTIQNVLSSIALNASFNPEVTAAELNSTLKVFVTHYGAAMDVNSILSIVSTLAQNDANLGLDHLSSVRTLLAAQPANQEEANPFDIQNALYSISLNASFNPEVTAAELNSTLKVFVKHYGTATDVNVILDTVSQIANNDTALGTDNATSLRTLLGTHPDNIAMVDPFNLDSALQAINGNNQNFGMSEHELAQTLSKFMTSYGALTLSSSLADAIVDNAEVGTYEAAGAIVNHLSATQNTSIAATVNATSTAELLSAGNDLFNGTTSDKLAVYGGKGKDIIDFSGNADTTGRYLDGGAGSDTLSGGFGDDILTGGAGADIFHFGNTSGAIDHVTDFNASQGDRINLHDVLDAFSGFNIDDYVSLNSVGNNTILSIDVDGAGTAHGFVQLAQLDNRTGLDLNELYAHGQIIA